MTIKNKFFATATTAALVASAIVPVASAAVELKDADQIQTWAKEEVQELVNEEIIQGDDKGYFNPKNIVTRAAAAEMLYKAKKLSTEGTENFPDVNEKDWFYEAVVATSKAEIFEGNDKGEFKPNDKLTREQAAAVIVRAFGLTGEADLSSFDDDNKISGWAKSTMEIAVATGVVEGNGTSLKPLDSISRAEIAVMIHRAMEIAEQGDQTAVAKAALETAITEAEAVETTGKTEETVQALEAAITAAKEVVADEEATVEQLTAAKTAVEEAVAGLVDEEVEIPAPTITNVEFTDTDLDAVEIAGELKVTATNTVKTTVKIGDLELTSTEGTVTIPENTPHADVVITVTNAAGVTFTDTYSVEDKADEAQTGSTFVLGETEQGKAVDNGFGAYVVSFLITDLTGELASKTNFTITVKETEYTFTQSSVNENRYNVSIPKTAATIEEILASTVTAK